MMQRILFFICTALVALSLLSCSDEVAEGPTPQVAFAVRPDAEGLVEASAKYHDGTQLSYTQTLYTYGGVTSPKPFSVSVAADATLLEATNTRLFGNDTSLYYRLLDASRYSFPANVEFQADSIVSRLRIDFNLKGLDQSKTWVLPLKITANNDIRAERQQILLKIVPTNDYSGIYEISKIDIEALPYDDDSGYKPHSTVGTSQRVYAVDETTVYFYAALLSDTDRHRDSYKVYARINPTTKTFTMWADNKDINFKPADRLTYTVTEQTDANIPGLIHRFYKPAIEYTYNDITQHPGHRIPYRVKTTPVLEKKIETLATQPDFSTGW